MALTSLTLFKFIHLTDLLTYDKNITITTVSPQ